MSKDKTRKFRVGDLVNTAVDDFPEQGRVVEVGAYAYMVGVEWCGHTRSWIEDAHLELAEPLVALSRSLDV
jgi:hypothetical protein